MNYKQALCALTGHSETRSIEVPAVLESRNITVGYQDIVLFICPRCMLVLRSSIPLVANTVTDYYGRFHPNPAWPHLLE